MRGWRYEEGGYIFSLTVFPYSTVCGILTITSEEIASEMTKRKITEALYQSIIASDANYDVNFLGFYTRGRSKISGTEFIVGKRKYLQVTRCYLLQNTTHQIACSDSSDPSTFQCMPGRLVREWPASVVSYLVVSPRRLEIVFPSRCSSAWGRERSRRGHIW
jgi:hypothetical protein